MAFLDQTDTIAYGQGVARAGQEPRALVERVLSEASKQRESTLYRETGASWPGAIGRLMRKLRG